MSGHVGKGFGGNREVSPLLIILDPRGDLSGAWVEACQPKASDVA